MHWHIGMSSASCTGDHGGPRFKSWQGRVIFHHKFECKLTRRPYISAMPMLSEPSGHITNLSPNSNHITFTQLNVEKERKNNSKYLITPRQSLIKIVVVKVFWLNFNCLAAWSGWDWAYSFKCCKT